MTQDWSVPGWAVLVAGGLLVLVILVLGLVVRASRLRVEAQIALTQQAAQALAAQVAELEARLADTPRPGSAEKPSAQADFVITRVGEVGVPPEDAASREPLPRAVFADLVLRETAVRAAGLGAGLRRALAPETRNRIRFEMKQEVKRSRKQRKADLRVARREWEARQRAADSLDPDSVRQRSA